MFLPVVVFLGLVFGSFATALIHRVPRDLPWAGLKGWRSACAHCSHVLGWKDLVPVYSWVSLKGRCRHCAASISKMYIAVELVVLAMCLLAYAVHGPSLETFFIMLAVPLLVALLVIDVEFMILPNVLIAMLAVLGILRAIATSFIFHTIMPFYMAFVGAALFGAIVWGLGWVLGRVLKKDALGFGDVKFFAASGFWLSIEPLPLYFLLAGGFGVAFSVFWKIKKGGAVFPFGPALIAAFYVLLIFNESLFP